MFVGAMAGKLSEPSVSGRLLQRVATFSLCWRRQLEWDAGVGGALTGPNWSE